MTEGKRPNILLTNDDGIDSPGIWAAAKALAKLGFVTIAAPRDQASATGRSMPLSSDGRITRRVLDIGDQKWETFAIGGSPAQAVLHAVLELMPERPDLLVSGINYGENLGQSITVSGTVGAAMEGAAMGIPSIAASLQLHGDVHYLSYSDTVDFEVAGHFVKIFAQLMLEHKMPADVQLLKIDVPHGSTVDTPWEITSLAPYRYYMPYVVREGSLEEKGQIAGRLTPIRNETTPKTDVFAMAFANTVSVTPISLDMTSRVDLSQLEADFRKQMITEQK